MREYSLTMTEVKSPAAERLLSAAMHLFATKGYEETSVGDIQVAAGLTYGSGALYKHFPSKQAVLEAGINRFIDTASTERAELASLHSDDFGSSLEMIAAAVMQSFRRDHEALRIVWRDLDRFPELQDAVRGKRIRATYDDFAKWLAAQRDHGRIHIDDPQATASVMLASLAFFHVLEALMGDTPGGLSEQRFTKAWVSLGQTLASRERD